MNGYLILFAFLAALCVAWPSGGGGGISDVSDQMGLGPQVKGRVIANTDWNNDKDIDLIVLDETGSILSVWLWTGTYEESPARQVDFSPLTVVSAAAADLNRDGLVDLVVQHSDNDAHIILNGPNLTVVKNIFSPMSIDSSIPQVAVLNVFGVCGSIDIVATSTQNQSLVVLKNLGDEGTVPPNCNFIGGIPYFETHILSSDGELVIPGSVSSVDLDGNCVADLIYGFFDASNTKMLKYKALLDISDLLKVFSFQVPEYVGYATWIDYNGDGAVDVGFPACVQPSEQVNGKLSCLRAFDAMMFMFNIPQRGICPGDDCCAGHGVHFANAPNASAAGLSWFITLQQAGLGGATLADSPQIPALLRSCDFNRDTLSDIAVATTKGPYLLANNGGSGSFSVLDLPFTPTLDPSHYIPFFYDISDDGTVDFVVTNTEGKGGIFGFWNGIDSVEYYFLTATTLNGVKGKYGFPPWGAAQVGAVHRFQWQDIDTNLRSASNTQLSASSLHALQTPRVHFGLARTFSYIQSYATGMKIEGIVGHNTWTVYLVPNSQVVCLSYPIMSPSEWDLKLFLSPSRFMKLLVIALLVVLASLGLPILYLKWREFQEDQAEMKRFLQ